jgi:hypothetical protein
MYKKNVENSNSLIDPIAKQSVFLIEQSLYLNPCKMSLITNILTIIITKPKKNLFLALYLDSCSVKIWVLFSTFFLLIYRSNFFTEIY